MPSGASPKTHAGGRVPRQNRQELDTFIMSSTVRYDVPSVTGVQNNDVLLLFRIYVRDAPPFDFAHALLA